MKIVDVRILNWEPLGNPPGKDWWAQVEAKPDEPAIRVAMLMRLSWREYQELLDKADEGKDPKPCVTIQKK